MADPAAKEQFPYFRPGGDAIREVGEQAGDVAPLQDLVGRVGQVNLTALAGVEGTLAPLVDAAPNEVVVRANTFTQMTVFAKGTLGLWAWALDKANHTSERPGPRAIAKLREEYVRLRGEHWGVNPNDPAFPEGEADQAYIDARHAAKEEQLAALLAERDQLHANLDADAEIVASTFQRGPEDQGMLRAMVIFGALAPEDLAAFPGVALTQDEWKTYLIQRFTPTALLRLNGNGLPDLTDIPPEFREALLNDPEVMAAVAAGLDVDGEQGRRDAELLAEDPAAGDSGRRWNMYQRLAWVSAYADYGQSHLWNYENVQLTEDMRNYLANFFETATEDGVGTLNDHIRENGVHANQGPAADSLSPTFGEVIANSLLALSSEAIGGGYDQLPVAVKDASVSIGSVAYREGLYFEDRGDGEDNSILALAQLLEDSTVSPGESLSKHMFIRLMQSPDALEHWPENNVMPDELDINRHHNAAAQTLLSLLDVASRNREALHDLMTGEDMWSYPSVAEPSVINDMGDEEQFTSDSPQDNSKGDVTDDDLESLFNRPGTYDPIEFVRELYTQSYEDNGESAAAAVRWMGTERFGPNDELATEAFMHFANYLTSTGDGGIFNDILQADGDRSGVQINPALADATARVSLAYLDWLSADLDDPDPEQNAAELAGEAELTLDYGEAERLLRLANGTDDSATTLALGLSGASQVMMESVDHVDAASASEMATRLGRLMRLYDASLNNEAVTETHEEDVEDDAAQERRNNILRALAAASTGYAIDTDPGTAAYVANPPLGIQPFNLLGSARSAAVNWFQWSVIDDTPADTPLRPPNHEITSTDASEFTYNSTYDLLQTQVERGAIDPSTLDPRLRDPNSGTPQLIPFDQVSLQRLEEGGLTNGSSMAYMQGLMEDALMAGNVNANVFLRELESTYDEFGRYALTTDQITAYNERGELPTHN